MLRGVMDCFAEEDTELGNSVVCSSDSSHPPTSASTTHFDRLHGSHSSSAATSSLQPYPPPFHMNASAGLCGPVLHGASTYGQVTKAFRLCIAGRKCHATATWFLTRCCGYAKAPNAHHTMGCKSSTEHVRNADVISISCSQATHVLTHIPKRKADWDCIPSLCISPAWAA